jgi:hypothetical protein
MCRVEERVYFSSEGHQTKFEDEFPCDKSRNGRLCSNVKRRSTEYYPNKGRVSHEDGAPPAPLNPPTPTGSGSYLVQQRPPTRRDGRRDGPKAIKPEIIIEFGSKKDRGKKYTSVSLNTARKRASLGATSSDVEIESDGSDASYVIRTGFPDAPVSPPGSSATDASRTYARKYAHSTASGSSNSASSQVPSLTWTSDGDDGASPHRRREGYPPTVVHNPSIPEDPSGSFVDRFTAPVISSRQADRDRLRQARREEARQQEQLDREVAGALAKEENVKQVRFELGRAEGRARERAENIFAQKEKQRAEEREQHRRQRTLSLLNEEVKGEGLPSGFPKDVPASGATRPTKLLTHSLGHLQGWLEANQDNPYPSTDTKRNLAQECGMTERQVTTWFTNARARQLGLEKGNSSYYNPRDGNRIISVNSSRDVPGYSTSRPSESPIGTAFPSGRVRSNSSRRTSFAQPNPPKVSDRTNTTQTYSSPPSARTRAPPPVSSPSNFNSRPGPARLQSFSLGNSPFSALSSRKPAIVDNPFAPTSATNVNQDLWDIRSKRDTLPTTHPTLANSNKKLQRKQTQDVPEDDNPGMLPKNFPSTPEMNLGDAWRKIVTELEVTDATPGPNRDYNPIEAEQLKVGVEGHVNHAEGKVEAQDIELKKENIWQSITSLNTREKEKGKMGSGATSGEELPPPLAEPRPRIDSVPETGPHRAMDSQNANDILKQHRQQNPVKSTYSMINVAKHQHASRITREYEEKKKDTEEQQQEPAKQETSRTLGSSGDSALLSSKEFVAEQFNPEQIALPTEQHTKENIRPPDDEHEQEAQEGQPLLKPSLTATTPDVSTAMMTGLLDAPLTVSSRRGPASRWATVQDFEQVLKEALKEAEEERMGKKDKEQVQFIDTESSYDQSKQDINTAQGDEINEHRAIWDRMNSAKIGSWLKREEEHDGGGENEPLDIVARPQTWRSVTGDQIAVSGVPVRSNPRKANEERHTPIGKPVSTNDERSPPSFATLRLSVPTLKDGDFSEPVEGPSLDNLVDDGLDKHIIEVLGIHKGSTDWIIGEKDVDTMGCGNTSGEAPQNTFLPSPDHELMFDASYKSIDDRRNGTRILPSNSQDDQLFEGTPSRRSPTLQSRPLSRSSLSDKDPEAPTHVEAPYLSPVLRCQMNQCSAEFSGENRATELDVHITLTHTLYMTEQPTMVPDITAHDTNVNLHQEESSKVVHPSSTGEIHWPSNQHVAFAADSDNESNGSSYANSVMSVATLASTATDFSINSKYSAIQIAEATKELIVILRDDGILVPLYKRAVADVSIGPERLLRNLRRFFKTYAEHLGKEAGDTLEFLASRLVQIKARAVAQHVLEKYDTRAEASLRLGQTEKHDESSDEDTETIPVDESVFGDLALFREFLVDSESFVTLRAQIASFILPRSAREEVMKAAEVFDRIDITSAHDKIEQVPPISNTCGRPQPYTRALQILRQAINDTLVAVDYLEPPLKLGFTRLRWQCVSTSHRYNLPPFASMPTSCHWRTLWLTLDRDVAIGSSAMCVNIARVVSQGWLNGCNYQWALE